VHRTRRYGARRRVRRLARHGDAPSPSRPAAPVRPRTPKGRTREVARASPRRIPDAVCELDSRHPFELLAATILSAQTTDANVNKVTPRLFARYPTAADLAAADPSAVEQIIKSTGFYQNKTKSLIGMANALVDRFDGEVPTALEDLVTIPGVGRKTGNVVRSVAFRLPGLPVDTHVGRLSRRLGLTTQQDPVKVELELNSYLPAAERGDFSLRMILHGRRVCFAQRPDCAHCTLEDICPSSQLPGRRRRSKIAE
jgi:endonuclease-3